MTVLDTLRASSASFLRDKPSYPADNKFVDEEFSREQALGEYTNKYQWRRPQVRHVTKSFNILISFSKYIYMFSIVLLNIVSFSIVLFSIVLFDIVLHYTQQPLNLVSYELLLNRL